MEKVSLFPLELPITLAKTFYSGPWDCVAAPRAAIPLRSPGAVEGLHAGRACVPAVSSCPCRRGHRLPARQREALSGRLRQRTRSGHGAGGNSTRTGLALSPVHGGGKDRASLLGFRSMAGSSPAQRTVWTNPALWSATNQENFCFLRAGAGDGAGVLCGGRRAGAGQFPHGGGKSPMGWFGERREKRPRRGESPAVRGKGRYGYPRTGRDAASGRSAKGPCLVGAAPEGTMPEEGTSGCMCCPKALQSIGMSRVDGSLHTCNDWGPCRRFAEALSPIKRAGRGREFEGGGTFSR